MTIYCTMCRWSLTFSLALEKLAYIQANDHIQFHADQLVADVESYLETIGEELDG